MSNEFYDHLAAPQTGSQLSSAVIRAEFAKIEQGFDKLPSPSANANKLLAVNPSGTAVTATDTPDINGGTIDNTQIGSVTPGTGVFTTLAANTSMTAPTRAADDATTNVATTAFVIGQAASTSPNMDGSAATGTSSRYARADHVHPTDTSRAPLASPTFTGTPAAPTAAVGTNTTQIATTAFVNAEIANDVVRESTATNILMNGVQSAGSSSNLARADHVHPTDTSRAPVANPTFTGTVTLGLSPTQNMHAATKEYVDGVATGLDSKAGCRVATTANINLATGGLLTIDGVTVIAGDRVLVKNQSTLSQNGIYVAAAGAWSRSTDADSAGEIRQGTYVFVNEGTTQAKTGWTQQTSGTITIGTSDIVWNQFSSAQLYTAGAALSLSGNTFNVTTVPVANGGTGATDAATARTNLGLGTAAVESTVPVSKGGTGATTFTSGGLLRGNGTGALSVASAADIATAIGTTAVTNATNAANVAVTNDTTTNATHYVVLGDATSGNDALKVSSTKLTFNPSTGMLTATGFTGPLTGNASTATSATTATNLASGAAGQIPYQSGAGATAFSSAGTAGQALVSGGTGAPTWGTLGVAAGGTGATTAAGARTNLGVPGTDGSGATGTWSINITGSAGSASTASTAGNVTGTVAVANGGTGATTLTGVVIGNGAAAFTTKTNPSGDFVGTTDAQTLANKTLTSPRVGTSLLDANGNELFLLTATASAVNELTYANAAAGGSPTFTATGSDANISINLVPKGTGKLMANNVDVVTVSGTQTLTNKTIGGSQISGNISGNAANVTGTVAVANGGTGATTLTGLVKGNGTSAFTAAVAGTDYVVPSGSITGNAATATTATTVSDGAITTLKIADNAVTLTKLADIATGTVLGRSTAGTGDPEALTVLPAVSGTNLTNLNASNLASGTVPTARLGSGTADSTTFLRGDGQWASVSTTGRLIAVTRFTASGTWTKNSATTRIYVEAMGGGGSGSGGGTGCGSGKSGIGGCGGQLISAFSSSPPASAAVTVGAGGAAPAAGAAGNAGGSTSLAAVVTAAGGAGGQASSDSTGSSAYPTGGGGNAGGRGGGNSSNGTAAAANTGGGGGGGGGGAGTSGGAGGSGWLTVWEFA